MKDTNNLRQELMEAPSLDQFLSENQDSFNQDSICELLNRLFQKRRISKATLAKQSGMSEVYLHQVFSGWRNPSRSRLLCLCFGLNASLEETQETIIQALQSQYGVSRNRIKDIIQDKTEFSYYYDKDSLVVCFDSYELGLPNAEQQIILDRPLSDN